MVAGRVLRLQILLQAVEETLETQDRGDPDEAAELERLRANLLRELAEAERESCGCEPAG